MPLAPTRKPQRAGTGTDRGLVAAGKDQHQIVVLHPGNPDAAPGLLVELIVQHATCSIAIG